jgi:predicted amidohydrolase YtcJ
MHATLIVIAGAVFDGHKLLRGPRAVVVERSRIAAVVRPEEVEPFVGPGTRVLTRPNAFLCPGFHDAHQHVLHAALFPSALATEYVGTSEQDCVEHMQRFAQTRPWGSWLVSHGWRSMLWRNPTTPTRLSLDAAFPDRPVAMYSGDAHTLWLNTQAMRELGVFDAEKHRELAPAGWERDEQGRLTGIVREAEAMRAMAQVVASFDQRELVRVVRDYVRRLNALGITSVCDLGLSAVPGCDCIYEALYQELEAAGDLTVRTHLYPSLPLDGDTSRIEHLQATLDGPRLRAPGVKLFYDGVSSAHTAWLREPYANPYFPGDCGRPALEPAHMERLITTCAKKRIAVRIHTIGDAAIASATAAIARAYAANTPAQGANCLEHLEGLYPDDVAALAKAGVVASVQPQHVVIDVTQPERDLGPQRASYMWPFKDFLAAGVPLAFGSDVPCVEVNPMATLHDAITRRLTGSTQPPEGFLPQQRIGAQEALAAYTAGSARAVGRAGELGTLEPGAYADFVMLDANVCTVNPEHLRLTRTLATVMAGRVVFEA